MALSLLSLAVLGLTGCGPQTIKPDTDVTVLETDLHAGELYPAGNFYATAEEYLALAKSDPLNAIRYQLNAADTLIKGQKIDQAKQIIDLLPQEKLSDAQKILKNTYSAQILLAKDDPEAAYALTNINLPSDTPRPVLAKYHETRATVLHEKTEYFAAAKERIFLNSYLDDAHMIYENYHSLWKSLSHLSPDELDAYRSDDTGILTSWLELTVLYKTMLQNTMNLEDAIAMWQQRYPDHPALDNIIPDIIDRSRQLPKQPLQVALLLPFTGKYNDVSIAIREGFMAAWYESKYNKPIIRIYNTDADNVVEIYEQAIVEGAEFIVGPLQKSSISNLIKHGDIKVTTLVLNQYDGELDATNNFNASSLPAIIQFGLSPEEEAKQVAERAWFDGHARAISITMRNERGRRVNNAFVSHWQKLGGTILDHISIGQNIEELTNAIRSVLNIDQSEQRSKDLRNKLQRSLKTESRRRQDIDLIFMAVPPTTARQVVPQLRYYRIADIALYSISNIYTGNINTSADSDINDVLFIDMPWIIDLENKYSPLNRMIERYRKPTHSAYKRFYALGIDAYRLIPRIAELILQPSKQYEGKTGYIKLDEEGRVHRRLIWARFVDGKPELSDATGLN